MYTPQDIEIFKGVTSGWLKIKLAYLLALQGSMVAASLAVSIKLFKHFYLKNLRVVQLQKENIATQLQILKAEVHPHFLFNTLNNIFYQIQDESPKGSKMIKGLSDILSYILYNGQNQYVPLKQELLMIKEYISLEKIRYGNKLDIYIKLPEKMDDVYIAPFLILPFVENCFKHGTSNMLQNPWINLTVELTDTLLTMKLMNGKASVKQETNSQSGIGISNVRQRLELMYKGKYDLQIRDEDDVFVVDLKVELARIENFESINNPDEQKVEITYA